MLVKDSNCTYFSICDKVVKKAFLPVDFLKNAQTLPALAYVVRHLRVQAVEEQSIKTWLNNG